MILSIIWASPELSIAMYVGPKPIIWVCKAVVGFIVICGKVWHALSDFWMHGVPPLDAGKNQTARDIYSMY